MTGNHPKENEEENKQVAGSIFICILNLTLNAKSAAHILQFAPS